MDMDAFGCRVVGFVLKPFDIAHNRHVHGIVVAHIVAKNLDIRIGHDQHPCSARDEANDIALWCEIVGVVGIALVVEYPNMMPALLRQVRQIEDQDAAGIVGQLIGIDISIIAVLDLEAGHVIFATAVADDDVFRLADINARV